MSWHENKERLLKMISSAGHEFWSRSAFGRPIKTGHPAIRVTLDDRWDRNDKECVLPAPRNDSLSVAVLDHFLFGHGLRDILLIGLENVLKRAAILGSASMSKQLAGDGWNRQ
jgi:hypothetical protein